LRNDYATRRDFCSVFQRQMNHLYLLALLLTGDELSAEKCFLAAFDSCEEGVVFRQWTSVWSRRCVVKHAIKFTSPTSSRSSHPDLVGNRSGPDPTQDGWLKCVQDLPLFDRFVFVMTVLEHYADRECALLLGCTHADVPPARLRALQQLSTSIYTCRPRTKNPGEPYKFDSDLLECG
jgi:hypothetical protein